MPLCIFIHKHFYLVVSKKNTQKEYSGRGLSLYRAASASHKSNEEIAISAGYKGNTIYSHFSKPDLKLSILVKYGKAIPFDFSLEYPELLKFFKPEIPINNQDSYALKLKFEEIQQKYTNLLEVHNELFRDYSRVKEELSDALRKIETLNKAIKTISKK